MAKLAQHKEFETLIEYWQIEHDRLDGSIDGLKGKELEEAVMERRVVRKHLTWMETLLDG